MHALQEFSHICFFSKFSFPFPSLIHLPLDWYVIPYPSASIQSSALKHQSDVNSYEFTSVLKIGCKEANTFFWIFGRISGPYFTVLVNTGCFFSFFVRRDHTSFITNESCHPSLYSSIPVVRRKYTKRRFCVCQTHVAHI
jgi:hypothetical protein